MTSLILISRLFMQWSARIQEPPAGPAIEVHAGPAPVEPETSTRVVPVGPPAVTPPSDAAAAGDWSALRDRRRLGRRLAGGGFAGLGAAFVANLLAAVRSGTVGEDPTTMAGLVPVIGPFLLPTWAGTGAPGLKAFFVLDGVAQLGFLAMAITGVVIAKQSRRALDEPRFYGLNGRLERRLEVDPDLRRRGRLGLGLALGGFGVFGVTYLGTSMTMLSAEHEGLYANEPDVRRVWAVAPLVGPFVIAGQADAAGTRAATALLGVLQIGSLAAGITGAVLRVRRVRDAESRVLQNLSIAPWHGGMTTGLSLHGQF